MSAVQDLKAYQVTGLTMRVECKDLGIWINKTTISAQKNDVLVSIMIKKFNHDRCFLKRFIEK